MINMELLDLYDEKGNKLNNTVERGKQLNNDDYIMLSIVFIENSQVIWYNFFIIFYMGCSKRATNTTL